MVKTVGSVGVTKGLNTATAAGGTVRVGIERPGPGKRSPEARIRGFDLFADHQFLIGASRFGVSHFERASVKSPRRAWALLGIMLGSTVHRIDLRV